MVLRRWWMLFLVILGALVLTGSAQAVTAYGDEAAIPAWAQADVKLTTQFLVFQGDDTGNFRPAADISRAEFTAILMRAFSLEPDVTLTLPFVDVAGGWYEGVVRLAVQTGVIQAADFGTSLRPNQAITRAEMARMVARAVDLRRVKFTPGQELAFSDVPASHPFHGAIVKASSYGIINGMGDGTFQPEATATRAQAAVMIARAMRLGSPQEHDVQLAKGYSLQAINKTMTYGPDMVIFAGVELAAVRQPGTNVDLSSLAVWMTPAAREKFERILNRDIPARQKMGWVTWLGELPTYIGEDHAIYPGVVMGTPNWATTKLYLPMQRQFDGRWVMLDVPFDQLDPTQFEMAPDAYTSYVYTTPRGEAVYALGMWPKNADHYLNEMAQAQWAGGKMKVLRIGNMPYEDSSYRVIADEVQQKVNFQAGAPQHYVVYFDGEPVVKAFTSFEEMVEHVATFSVHMADFVEIDGVPWPKMAESTFFVDLIRSAPQEYRLTLYQVIRSNPAYYASKFEELLIRAKQTSDALRN